MRDSSDWFAMMHVETLPCTNLVDAGISAEHAADVRRDCKGERFDMKVERDVEKRLGCIVALCADRGMNKIEMSNGEFAKLIYGDVNATSVLDLDMALIERELRRRGYSCSCDAKEVKISW